MKESVFNELNVINQIVNTSEKYKRLRKLYCSNQDVELVAIAYAKVLSRLNEASYLQKALKLCDKLISKKSKLEAEANLIRYQVNKRLNPNMSIRTLNKELDNIDVRKESVKREVLFEKLLLLTDANQVSFDKLKQSYLVLLKSCSKEEHILKNSICTKLFSLLIKNNDYQEVLNVVNYLKDNDNYYMIPDIERSEFYAKYKLGNIKKEKLEFNKLGYYERQIVDYSESNALSHITKHIENNRNYEVDSFFRKDIDIQSLFYNIKSFISNIEPVDSLGVSDSYIITTEKPVGVADSQTSSTVKVITEIGTKNIHTMYPIGLKYDCLVQKQSNPYIRVKKIKQ